MELNIIYITVSLINSINLMFAMSNILLFPIQRVNKLLITIYIFFFYLLAVPHIGQYGTFLVLGGILLLTIASNKKNIINIIFSLLGYFIYILINHILLFFTNKFGISTSELYLYNYRSIIFILIYAILVFTATYYAGKFIRNKLAKITTLPKIVQALFSIETLCCAAIIISFIIIAENNNYPSHFINFNLFLFGILITVTFVISFLIIYFIQKNDDLYSIQKEKLSLEKNSRMIENFYLFFKNIHCEGTESDTEDFLEELDKIKILELKSILYSKLLEAKNNKLQIQLNIHNPFQSVSMDILDLSKVMEEFLNNAIDEACESENRKLKILLLADDISSTILIANSSKDLPFRLEEIDKEGLTSKHSHEGMGLSRVNHILSKYRNVAHTMNYIDNVFTQTLEVCTTKE